MASFSIDINSLTGNDQVDILIGTSAGASDVASYSYTTTGSKAETFEPTAETLWMDIQGYDTFTDAHTILIDNVSIIDDTERITNGTFTTDLTGWTSVIATNAVSASQLSQTGFGGPASPTTLRQSFATSFSATPASGGSGGGCRTFRLRPDLLPPEEEVKKPPPLVIPMQTMIRTPQSRNPSFAGITRSPILPGFAEPNRPQVGLPDPIGHYQFKGFADSKSPVSTEPSPLAIMKGLNECPPIPQPRYGGFKKPIPAIDDLGKRKR